MTEDRIENLLGQADRTAGPPAPVLVNLAAVRRHAGRSRAVRTVGSGAIAAVLLITLGIWAMGFFLLSILYKVTISVKEEIEA